MRRLAAVGLVAGSLVGPPVARAQYTDNNQTNIISGVMSNWSGDYVVGSNAVFDVLLIKNGGTLVSGGSHIGYAGTNNSAVVSDIGSIWKTVFVYVGDALGSSNSLVITNGGRVANEGNSRIGRFGSNNNRGLVSGSGSSWSNTNELTIGEIASGNSLVVSNGGAISDSNAFIGDSGANTNNSATVTGNGSTWTNWFNLNVGAGAISNSVVINDGGIVFSGAGLIGYAGGRASRIVVDGVGSLWKCQGNLVIGSFTSEHSLAISNDGLVMAANLFVGSGTSSSNNLVSLDTGSLVVTNGSGSGVLSVLKGTVMLNAGTITVDQFSVFNTVTFISGTLHTGTTVTNGQQFIVGDGSSMAALDLLGGVHSFNNGLRIRNSATLSGCGTINGVVAVDAGATVLADCSPLVFGQSFTNNGSMNAINGSVLEAYGTVVNNGLINAIHGATNFHGAFINNGIVLDADGDYDGDGLSNLQEDQAGTDPTNSASVFQIVSVVPTNNAMLVSWTVGGGRTNVVQSTTDLTGSYTNVSPNIALPGSGDVTTNYLDAGGATNASSQFYRIRLVP